MNYLEESLNLHKRLRGKLEMKTRVAVADKEALSLAYTPGVAQPCLEIQKNPSLSYELTRRWNTVAVITDGTAVLGLGDIGPEAGMPVMEGKCVLFKEFGDVDAIPLCIRSKDTDEIVKAVSLIAGSFGGINLEDISAPRCFEIERRLKEICDIPVFHDDQHGTAVVVLAAITNALKLADKKIETARIIINGAGSAGIAIAKLLLSAGAVNLILCDKSGAIYDGAQGLNPEQIMMSKITNPENRKEALADVIKGADVFIGVSAPRVVTE
jgi:malate dehydrogenase (oxaloacetate-decarboxylating)